jgi:predicted phage tail protein
MPQAAVALAASWAGGWLATSVFGLAAGGLGAAIVGGVIATGLTKVGLGLLGGNNPGSASSVGSSGILINDAGTVTSIPIVYGQRRVGAKRVYVGNSGTDNKYLQLVSVLCEGPIYGIGNIYFNGVPVASAAGIATQTAVSGGVVVPGTAGTSPIADGGLVTAFYDKIIDPNDPTQIKDNPYGAKTKIYVHYGTDSQTVDTNCQSAVGATTWTNNHRLRGVAYLYIQLEYDKNVFGGAPEITVDIAGRKVEKYTTPTAHSTATATNGDYNNPAWILLDYMTNARLGRGIDIADIDVQSFIDTASYCASSQAMTVAGQSTPLTQRYLINGALDPDNTLFQNIKNILASCNAMLVFTGGKYRMILDKPVDTADIDFRFNEENIIGGLAVSLGSKTTRFNKVKVNYFDPTKEWTPNIIILESSTYRTEDGAQVLEKEIELPLVSNYQRAQFIAQLFMNQSRYGITVQFTAASSALVCSVGDVVYISHPTPDWTDKPFRITHMVLKEDGTVGIQASEYDSDVYTPVDIPANTVRRNYSALTTEFFTPQANPVGAPSSITATNTPKDGTNAMTVTFTGSTDPRVTDYVIEYTNNKTSVTQRTTTSSTSLTITGLDNSTSYTVKVYGRTSDGRLSQGAE